MAQFDKYQTSYNESDIEIQPNLLGLTDKDNIAKEEAKGFAKTSIYTVSNLTNETIFDLDYIISIHKIAFEHLYSFCQNLQVNSGK